MSDVQKIAKWPMIIVGTFVALGTAFVFISGIVSTPKKLDDHIVAEKVYHDTTNIQVTEKVKELDTHTENNSTLLEAIVRGECLENARENLIRQGLILQCKKLGIDRTAYPTTSAAQSAPIQPVASDTVDIP